MEPKTDKRIVSKGEYTVNIGKKAALSCFGSAVFLIGAVCMALTCLGTIALLATMESHYPTWMDMCIFLVGVGLFGGGSAALLYFGKTAVKEARETQAGLPLTRANTADLPVPDSNGEFKKHEDTTSVISIRADCRAAGRRL